MKLSTVKDYKKRLMKLQLLIEKRLDDHVTLEELAEVTNDNTLRYDACIFVDDNIQISDYKGTGH